MTIDRTFARRFSQVLVATAGLLLGMGAARAADTVTYYHTDALGTPVMESNAAGTVTYVRVHKPYGEQALGAAKNGPGFTGHVSDADTALVYMQARYYDPIAARFISNDPVPADSVGGGNFGRYWYANNNPFKFIDPDGRVPRGSLDLCSNGCSMFDGGGGGGGGGDGVQEKKPITSSERKMQGSGNLSGFWQSRAKAGSEWAQTALGIWSPEDATLRQRALGSLNLFRLNAALVVRDGFGSNSEARGVEIFQMGREIAGRYILAVDQNRGFEPTLSQSNAYHYSVFSSHGLSGEAYGGTPLGYTPSGIGRYLGDAQSRALNWLPITTYCEGCSP